MVKLLILVFYGVQLVACSNSLGMSSKKIASFRHEKMRQEIEYGKELITRTAYYLGPRGKVYKLAQGRMNCEHCHLDGGTRNNANPFFYVHAQYPQYRAREGKVLTLADRVNNCIERNLYSKPLEERSREMTAILSYMKWVSAGAIVEDGNADSRLGKIAYLNRAADPKRGKVIYAKNCAECHGGDGQGKLDAAKLSFIYPPLWGSESFPRGGEL